MSKLGLISGLVGSLVLTVATGAAWAQPAQSAPARAAAGLPEAADIFERHIEAIGGRDAVFALKNRQMRGTFQSPDFETPVTLRIWAEAPSSFHMLIDEPAGRKIEYGYNGESGWLRFQDGTNDIKQWVDGPKLIELAESSDFYSESNYQERFSTMSTVKVVQGAAGSSLYEVRATSVNNRPYKFFFDTQTGLLRLTQTVVDDGTGNMVEMLVSMDNYREFGGVLFATTMVQRVNKPGADEAGGTVWRISSINVNTEEEHDFGPPAGMPPKPEAADEPAPEPTEG